MPDKGGLIISGGDTAKNNTKFALVVSGGGMRGAISAKIIAELDEALHTKLGNKYPGFGNIFNYMAGTSIGEFNIVNLCIKDENGDLRYTPQDNLQMFFDNAGKILKKNSFFSGINHHVFSSELLKNSLDEKWGDTKFVDENFSAKLLLTSYSLDKAAPTIWTNIGTEEQRGKLKNHVVDINNFNIKDVELASAAVPGAFNSVNMDYIRSGDAYAKKHHEIDGGVISGTPILPLICDIVAMDNVNLSDLCVISIGCGNKDFDFTNLAGKGVGNYLYNIKDFIGGTNASRGINDSALAEQLITANGGKFFEFNPTLTSEDHFNALKDTPENVARFVDVADQYLNENEDYFNEVVDYIASQILIT